MQDKITKNIVNALEVTLVEQENGNLARAKTINLDAYDAFLQGWGHYKRHDDSRLPPSVTCIKGSASRNISVPEDR
jgi:hypothetical protein